MATELTQTDVAAIETLFDVSLKALQVEDYERWRGYWTEDAVVMPPAAPRKEGEAGFREFWEQVKGRKYVLSDMCIEGAGDLAVVTTAITVPRAAPGQGADAGKQMLKLRRQPDGKWLFAGAILNFDTPTSL